MSSKRLDQQPIDRFVGQRTQAPAGTPPSREARAALDSHEEMTRDRERWTVDAIVETPRSRG